MNKISDLLEKAPFSLTQPEKEKVFLPEVRKMARWHYTNNEFFKEVCDGKSFDVLADFKLDDLPYFPASTFKDLDLVSVPKGQIIKTLYSSSTSGKPSKIMLDEITANSQTVALNKIMADFFGTERRNFVVFDTEDTVKSRDGELSSRGTAIRGLLPMAKKLAFILDGNLNLDILKLELSAKQTDDSQKTCYFGFTWLIYNIYLKNKDNKKALSVFKKLSNEESLFLHIGGWKKLKDIAVSKDDFNDNISKAFGLKKERIVDFYGMTEQLGTVYPDCQYGYKHAPLYSEIIIRDFDTLKPLAVGQAGFIQFISPIPHSYPGISLLSDDIGRLIGTDDCRCGRKGKYFVFEKRSETADLRGCGDTLGI